MKKFMYFAAALLVLVGCKKDNALNNAPEETPFKKGQQVTLTVGTGDNANQAAPRRVAGTDNGTQINFTWEAGDKILVKVGDKSAVFTLSSEPGSASGEFTGEMPADGSTFDIQYPIEAPDLNSQEYTADNPIPTDKMRFEAIHCRLGEDISLQAQYAMLQLNLYGTDKTVGKIVFKYTTSSPIESYTLTCAEGVKIGAAEDAATSFYMVVLVGINQFRIEVWDNATTPVMICAFTTSEARTFEAGKCMNMPAKEVADPYYGHDYVDLGLSVKWATCNVGATKPEEYGDYFAWGETEPYYDQLSPKINWKGGKTTGYCWLSYCDYNDFQEWSTIPYDATTKNLKPEYDAAATNWKGVWRMPTKDECFELLNSCSWEWTSNYNSKGVAGYVVKSNAAGNNNSIFLPAAGNYEGTSFEGQAGDAPLGKYWSSTLDENYQDKANYFFFLSDKQKNFNTYGRYYGYSVRPVCQ